METLGLDLKYGDDMSRVLGRFTALCQALGPGLQSG